MLRANHLTRVIVGQTASHPQDSRRFNAGLYQRRNLHKKFGHPDDVFQTISSPIVASKDICGMNPECRNL